MWFAPPAERDTRCSRLLGYVLSGRKKGGGLPKKRILIAACWDRLCTTSGHVGRNGLPSSLRAPFTLAKAPRAC